jgi:hypothetical protein
MTSVVDRRLPLLVLLCLLIAVGWFWLIVP